MFSVLTPDHFSNDMIRIGCYSDAVFQDPRHHLKYRSILNQLFLHIGSGMAHIDSIILISCPVILLLKETLPFETFLKHSINCSGGSEARNGKASLNFLSIRFCSETIQRLHNPRHQNHEHLANIYLPLVHSLRQKQLENFAIHRQHYGQLGKS